VAIILEVEKLERTLPNDERAAFAANGEGVAEVSRRDQEIAAEPSISISAERLDKQIATVGRA
jgi:hypothetical protein